MSTIGVIYFSDNELHCLDVAYGISSLRRIDHNLSVHKIDNESFDTEFKLLVHEKKDILVIFLSYGCYDLLQKICSYIKCINNKTSVIVCHSLSTYYFAEVLREINQIDIAVLGEYEETLYEICNHINENEFIERCKGIAYIKNGQLHVNNKRKLTNIDEITFPYRDFTNSSTRFFHVYGSRGCEAIALFVIEIDYIQAII